MCTCSGPQMSFSSDMDTTSTTKAPVRAVSLIVKLTGALPRTQAPIVISTDSARLIRGEIAKVREQLTEAAAAMLIHRAHQPQVSLHLAGDGRELRRTALVEAPDGDAYLVGEISPGGNAGTLDEWLVRAAVDFGRKRNL